MNRSNLITSVYLFLIILILSSCIRYDNFTAYFNTYYNANRLLKESEEEFSYQDEKKRLMPRVLIPKTALNIEPSRKSGMPPFLEEFIVNRFKRQPVNAKLDSIIIKGSKILAYKPKSDYVEDVLYLMAKTYFYREEWLPSQVKCSELIDKFPDGKLSPDAHLLLALNLLVQQKFYAGKIILSRTVDIAWQKKRYDILSDAFRIEAELALYENDLSAALKPYLQAVAQSDDPEIKARWQLELASLLFRMGMFERAEKEFAIVLKYKPDYLGVFEANLYRAASLIRLGKIAEAENILSRLENDGKFAEWKVHIYAQRMQIARLQNDDDKIAQLEKTTDSLFSVNPVTSAFYYERGVDLYLKHDYAKARMYFARGRASVGSSNNYSDEMYQLLNAWDSYQTKTSEPLKRLRNNEQLPDTSLKILAYDLFELGRVHSRLKNTDSSIYYYSLAMNVAPERDTSSARYYYVLSHSLRNTDLRTSDSLLEIIVERYPKTIYGKEAMKILGYTAAFIQDSVAELYSSGRDLMKFGDYKFAINQFSKVYQKFPQSQFAPKSIYNIGWIYERNLNLPDSALKYYTILIQNYPNTEYATDVRLSVEYLAAVRSGEPIPEHLKDREKVTYEKKEIQLYDPNFNPNLPKQQTLEDMLKPENLLKKVKEVIIDQPTKELENLKNINPSDLIPVEKKEPKDSTNTNQKPEIKKEKK